VARRGSVQTGFQLRFEKLGLGFDVLGQGLLGRYGDHADALELQAQILEELPHLAGTASQSGHLKDPFARLGHGVDGLLLERLANQRAIGCHFARGAMGVPSSQTVQPSLAKRGHRPLDGRPSDPNDLGRLLACDSVVQQANYEHPFTNALVGMRGTLFVDDALLFLSQPHAKPSHGVRPCVASRSRSTSLQATTTE
jgi:hypothetical protein